MKNTETITLGGGCFWCIDAVYREIEGINSVISGYAGGEMKNPSYEQVCSGNTGHAEVVQIIFDPTKISLSLILEIFFFIHDPTQLNRQGNDVGTQYRSIILTHNKDQEKIAKEIISNLENQKVYADKIVTEIKEIDDFYKAEPYHQDYYNNNINSNPYCNIVISPKINKFRKKYFDKISTSTK
jgi:peptide-methionine (S)-S-oxide reductase